MIRKVSKSFIDGYARSLDLLGIMKEWPDLSNSELKDYEALKVDWQDVGDTIRRETRNFGQTAGYRGTKSIKAGY